MKNPIHLLIFGMVISTYICGYITHFYYWEWWCFPTFITLASFKVVGAYYLIWKSFPIK